MVRSALVLVVFVASGCGARSQAEAESSDASLNDAGSIDAGTCSNTSPFTIAPRQRTIAIGATVQFSAAGLRCEGDVGDVTASVVWATSDPRIAQFSTMTPGLLTGLSKGGVTVTATWGAASAVATIGVLPLLVSAEAR